MSKKIVPILSIILIVGGIAVIWFGTKQVSKSREIASETIYDWVINDNESTGTLEMQEDTEEIQAVETETKQPIAETEEQSDNNSAEKAETETELKQTEKTTQTEKEASNALEAIVASVDDSE